MERRFRIKVDGKEYSVTVEELGEGPGQLYPAPGSMNVPVNPGPSTPAAATPAPQAVVAGADDVTSTLGGVVQEVLVTIGQQIAQGDKLVVIEAMKMKTPMIAHRAGKVAVIAVKAGDAVDAGQILLTLA